MSFDVGSLAIVETAVTSQSLSSRAMSFDKHWVMQVLTSTWVSIPFEQGDVFRHLCLVSIPWSVLCLNPFRAGRCLSTVERRLDSDYQKVSIPFEQGDVFRRSDYQEIKGASLSQSLSSRAMSFDCSGMLEAGIMRPFRPTSQFFWKVKELALDLSK